MQTLSSGRRKEMWLCVRYFPGTNPAGNDLGMQFIGKARVAMVCGWLKTPQSTGLWLVHLLASQKMQHGITKPGASELTSVSESWSRAARNRHMARRDKKARDVPQDSSHDFTISSLQVDIQPKKQVPLGYSSRKEWLCRFHVNLPEYWGVPRYRVWEAKWVALGHGFGK